MTMKPIGSGQARLRDGGAIVLLSRVRRDPTPSTMDCRDGAGGGVINVEYNQF